MGPPGSGKGTQSDLLITRLGYAHFSMGEALRDFGKGESEMAKRIKGTIDQGIIVNDDDAKAIFFGAIEKLANKYEGIILDGFPRTLGQLSMIEELKKEYQIKSFQVFFLDVDRSKLVDRLGKRKTCSVCKRIYLPGAAGYDENVCSNCGGKLEIREDDNAEGVAKRFDEYMLKTAPVKDYYEKQGILTHIEGDLSDNADESIKKVHEEIMQKLGL